MKEFEENLHRVFDEMDITLPDWRIRIREREIIGKSDWAWLYVDIYRKYAHKPCQCRKLAYNFVRDVIDWEKSIFYTP
jgi:hypothetical protein